MRYIRTIMVCTLPLLFSLCSAPGQTSFEFDYQGAESMIKVLQAVHDGASRDTVAALLDHMVQLEAYRVSEERNTQSTRSQDNHVSLSQFRAFISSFLDDTVATQGNKRLMMQKDWYATAIKDPARFEGAIQTLRSIPEAEYDAAFDLALHWLPDETVLDARIWVLFDIGGSGGWMYRTSDGTDHIGFNLLHMVDETGKFHRELFLGTLAHELQHMGRPLEDYYTLIDYDSLADTSRLKLYTDFFSQIIKEGMANKFCSNAPSRFSSPVNPDKAFAADETGVENWEFFSQELVDIHARAVRDLRAILNDQVDDPDQFWTDYRNYWTWWAGESEGRRFVLGRRYYYGAELLGAIHQAFGRELLLNATADIRRVPALYNDALRELQPPDYELYLFPDEVVQGVGEL
ncbi:DUF5700 domain-containing putative Zn-dependent protease [Candidatus Neomarinimicrobiota bacterium]